jgi:DNA-binding MarR family transcriptional regulator
MSQEKIRTGVKRHLLLSKAYKASLYRFLENISELEIDISFDEWMILGPIWNSEGCSQKECGEIATKDKTAVTRIINSLEEKNLVVRVLDQIDKRIKRIVLTKKGEKLFNDILPIIEKTRFQMNNDISEDELKTLDIVLKKLINNHESIKKN